VSARAGPKCDVGSGCFGVEVGRVQVDVAREGYGCFGAGRVGFVAVLDDD
jgi:hypothetical protein